MKRCNRFMAFVLTLALLITTFGGDLGSFRSYALEESSAVEAVEQKEEMPSIFESTTELGEEGGEAAATEEAEDASEVAEETEKAEEAVSGNETEKAGDVEAVTEADAENSADENGEGENTEAEEITDPEAEELETPDAEEEKTEEPKKVVEKEFKESTVVDGILISLYAEPGVLPADAVLKVDKVEDGDEAQIKDLIDNELGDDITVQKTYSYDINIVSLETGEKYNLEDNDTVEVKFSRVYEAASDDVSMEVYHVNDSLTQAESVSAPVDNETEISFDAEHFSIYTVTIYSQNESEEVESILFNITVVDESGVEIDTSEDIRNVSFDPSDNQVCSAEFVAPQIYGYTFKNATFNDVEFGYFRLISGYLYAEKNADDTNLDMPVNPMTSQETLKFNYVKNDKQEKYTSTSHISLELTDEIYTLAHEAMSVFVKIGNGDYQEMTDCGKDNDLDTCEYRLDLNGTKVTSTDVFTFKIVMSNGQEFVLSTNEKKNVAAYDRCVNAHKYSFDDFGFDFVLTNLGDMDIVGDVVYDCNFKTKETPSYYVDNIEWRIFRNKEYEVKSYEETGLPLREGHTFLGWSLNRLSKTADIQDTVSVHKGSTLTLYAVWQEDTGTLRDVYFYILRPEESVNVPNDSSPQKTLRFYPPEEGEYHLWSGKGYIAIADEDIDSNGNVYDKNGQTTLKYLQSYDEGVADSITAYLQDSYPHEHPEYAKLYNYTDVCWYTYKNANDNWGWHFDGYVKDVGVTVIYHKNVPGEKDIQSDPEYKRSGNTYYFKNLSDFGDEFAEENGWRFLGWNTEPTGDGYNYSPENSKHENDHITLMSNMELYGMWERLPQYTVTYTDGVEDATVFQNQTSNHYAGEDTPAFVWTKESGATTNIPERAGYEFKGWYKDEDTTDVFMYATVKYPKVTANVVYTATWEALDTNVTVNYYDKASKDKEAKVKIQPSATRTAKVDSTYVALDTDKVITGWDYDETSVDSVVVTADGNAQIDLYFSKIDYLTRYVDDDSDKHLLGEQTQYYGDATYTLESDPDKYDYDKKVSLKDYYDFAGWDDLDTPEKETLSSAAIAGTTVSGNKTFQAVYTEVAWDAYYEVHYFYQDKYGNYPDTTTDISELRTEKAVKLDEVRTVSVTPEDKEKTRQDTFDLDTNKNEWWSGNIDLSLHKNPDSPLVLRVYYKRPHTGLKLTLTAPSDSKTYDGTALTTEGKDPSSVVFTDGSDKTVSLQYTVKSVTYDGSVTDVATDATINNISAFEIEVTINGVKETYTKKDIDKNGMVTDSDLSLTQISLDPGYLTINPIQVFVTVPGAAKTYNGLPISSEEYLAYLKDKKIDGYTKKVDPEIEFDFVNPQYIFPADIKDVVASQAKTDEIGFDYDGFKIKNGATITKAANKKNNVEVVITNGDLMINPAIVILESDSLKKQFDGKVLVNGDTPLKVEKGIVDGEGFEYTFTGSQLKVGKSDNSFDKAPKKGTLETNYVFEDENGKSTITFGTLEVTPLEKKYKIVATLKADAEGDGNEKTVKYDGTIQKLDLNVRLHLVHEEEEHKVPDDETTPASVLSSLFSSLGSFFTITASAADKDEAEYITVGGNTYPVKRIEEDVTVDKVVYHVKGLKVYGGQGLNADDYDVTLDYTNMKIYVDVTDKDGKTSEVDVTADLLEEPKVHTMDAGDGTNTVSAKTEVIGCLHIIPRQVTITSASASERDRGQTLTKKATLADTYPSDQSCGFVMRDENNNIINERDGITITYTGKQKGVGRSRNYFDVAFDDVKALERNYEIDKKYGWLELYSSQDNPPEDPDDPPTPPQVLGAKRTPEAAVLGARRGNTEDTANNIGRIITIILAAGIGFTMIFLKRKKNEDQ